MNSSITNRQIVLMIIASTIGYGVVHLPGDAAAAAGTGAWMVIIFNTILTAIFTYFISYTGYDNENQTLFEYSQKLTGKTLGKIIVVNYIIYYLIILGILVRSYSEIVTITFLQRTPVWSISIFLLLVVAYAIAHNINTIARITEIYIIFAIIGYVFIHIILVTQGDIVNIRPIMGTENAKTYAKASYRLFFSFLGPEIISLIPINKTENKGIIKHSAFSIFFVGILYIFIVESAISVVGVEEIVYNNASVFNVIKGINLPYLDIFRRPDGIYFVFWSMSVFCSFCIAAYGIYNLLGKLLKNISSSIILVITIIITFILSQTPKTPSEVTVMLNIGSVMGGITLILIPSLLFIMSKVKKNGA